MAKKTRKRRKHVPQRTCVGCREVLAKRSMTRIVRRPDGVQIDPSGKLAGRGAYLHDKKTCWERGMRGAIASALKMELTSTDMELLTAYLDTLPDEETESNRENTKNTASANTGK